MFVDADGCRINVEVEGPERAPALIFSNSLGTDLTMWDDQAKAFAKDFRVIRYDQRGHGKSDAPPGPYAMDRFGRDALAVMDGLELKRADFCGISMGGMTGMWIARHAPERLRRLVLANTAAKSATALSWNTRIATVVSKGLTAIADMALGIWFTEGFRARAPQTISRMRETLVSLSPQGYVACCAGIRDMDQRWGIAAIKTPTFIIAGKHDKSTTLGDAELINKRIAGSELTVLDAAHISNVEQPAAFTKAVAKFLQKD
jgi:3-oxoadipate enol-lactonase